MKRVLWIAALLSASILTGCTLNEEVEVEIVECPQNDEYIQIDPWTPAPDEGPQIGH